MIAPPCVNESTLYVAFELGKKQLETGNDVGIWRGAVGADGARWRPGGCRA